MSAGRGSSEVNAMYTASASYAMRPTVLAGGVVLSPRDRKSTRLNSSHPSISYAVFCLKKKNYTINMGDSCLKFAIQVSNVHNNDVVFSALDSVDISKPSYGILEYSLLDFISADSDKFL